MSDEKSFAGRGLRCCKVALGVFRVVARTQVTPGDQDCMEQMYPDDHESLLSQRDILATLVDMLSQAEHRQHAWFA